MFSGIEWIFSFCLATVLTVGITRNSSDRDILLFENQKQVTSVGEIRDVVSCIANFAYPKCITFKNLKDRHEA